MSKEATDGENSGADPRQAGGNGGWPGYGPAEGGRPGRAGQEGAPPAWGYGPQPYYPYPGYPYYPHPWPGMPTSGQYHHQPHVYPQPPGWGPPPGGRHHHHPHRHQAPPPPKEPGGGLAGLLKSPLAALSELLDLDDREFWKGALVGVAAVLLLTGQSNNARDDASQPPHESA